MVAADQGIGRPHRIARSEQKVYFVVDVVALIGDLRQVDERSHGIRANAPHFGHRGVLGHVDETRNVMSMTPWIASATHER